MAEADGSAAGNTPTRTLSNRPARSRSAPAWVLPHEPAPVRLMNTVWADRHGVYDALISRDDLAGWLAATGLTGRGSPLNDDDLAHFRDLRDALRRLAALVTADDARPAAESAIPDATAAVAVLNAAAVAVHPAAPRLQLLGGALTRDAAPSGPPVAVARAALAAEAIELLTGETSPRLRACQAPGCVLYFLKDHPRREWCSTACGNRARAASYYHRHRPATATDS